MFGEKLHCCGEQDILTGSRCEQALGAFETELQLRGFGGGGHRLSAQGCPLEHLKEAKVRVGFQARLGVRNGQDRAGL